MVTISLCMIVKDEEAVLKRCLESAKEIADEMIVVDTGSRDQTREIAEKEGARVYQFPWIDDFAAARNFPVTDGHGTIRRVPQVSSPQFFFQLRMYKEHLTCKIPFHDLDHI